MRDSSTRVTALVADDHSGGTLGFALCADPGIIADVERLAGGIEDEVAVLLRAAGPG